MFEFFRVKSVSVRGLPGRPKIEVPIGYGPLIPKDRRRVEIHQAFLRKIEPANDHRLQEIIYE